MSVIACKIEKDKIEFAADSITIWGETKRVDSTPKLVKVNDIIIGGSGITEDLFLMNIFLSKNPYILPKGSLEEDILQFQSDFVKWCKKLNPDKTLDFNYIIGLQGKAFEVYDMAVNEIKNYTAIGAGFMYALPVLDMGGSAKQAVEEAIKFSTLCAAPVLTMKMRKKENIIK